MPAAKRATAKSKGKDDAKGIVIRDPDSPVSRHQAWKLMCLAVEAAGHPVPRSKGEASDLIGLLEKQAEG